MVQQVLEPVDVVAAAQQVQQDAGVEVAGRGCPSPAPRAASAPSRCPPATAVADRGRRRRRCRGAARSAAARSSGPAQEPGRLGGDVLVTDAVHAVPTDTLARRPRPGRRRTSRRRPGSPAKNAVSKTATCAQSGIGRSALPGSRPARAGCAGARARPAPRSPPPRRRRLTWARCSARRRARPGDRRRAGPAARHRRRSALTTPARRPRANRSRRRARPCLRPRSRPPCSRPGT